MTQRANGTFEVKLMPQAENKTEGAAMGRMSLHKTFNGEMQGTSEGEMLTAMGAVAGSAVYVAIERFKGTVHGKRGTFVISHRGTMNRGAQHLSVEIVPDSGTDELAGISGSMTISIESGKHFYELAYRSPG